jgi:hypothetical protein
VFLALLVTTRAANAEDFSKQIGAVQTIQQGWGEFGSVVVPPGKKTNCPNGRILATVTNVSPPTTGAVVGRDLNGSANQAIQATFEAGVLTDTTNYVASYSVDNDLVMLQSGNVVFVHALHIRAPLSSKPAWWDLGWKGSSFGPGARRGEIIWRSTDCGETFQYMSFIDPATTEDGSCAYPKLKKGVIGLGGTDGQLAQVDADNDAIYLTAQCVGNLPDTSQPGFVPSSTFLAKTQVLVSMNEGAAWNSLGFISPASWRYKIVALTANKVALVPSGSNAILFATKAPNGKLQLDPKAWTTPTSGGLEMSTFYLNPNIFDISKDGHPPVVPIKDFTWADTILFKLPSKSKLAIAFVSTIPNPELQPKKLTWSKTHGYRLFFFNVTSNTYAQADPILPTWRSINSFLVHLTAIDTGGGTLLYWYDVNAKTKKATVRARLVFSEDLYSDDFDISSFDMGTVPYFYGDYMTAGAFVSSGPALGITRYDFFPMWTQPDFSLRFSRVTIWPVFTPQAGPKLVIRRRIPKWHPGPPPVELKHLLRGSEVRLGEDEIEPEEHKK